MSIDRLLETIIPTVPLPYNTRQQTALGCVCSRRVLLHSSHQCLRSTVKGAVSLIQSLIVLFLTSSHICA